MTVRPIKTNIGPNYTQKVPFPAHIMYIYSRS